MSELIRRNYIPPTILEDDPAVEGAVAKVSYVRHTLPRSYAWIRTATGKARRVVILWDTGATHTIIHPRIVEDLGLDVKR